MTTIHAPEMNAPEMIHPLDPPQPAAQVELIRRASRLRAELESARRDNLRLERALVLERAENRRLREQIESTPPRRARDQRRRMLCEQCSRNP